MKQKKRNKGVRLATLMTGLLILLPLCLFAFPRVDHFPCAGEMVLVGAGTFRMGNTNNDIAAQSNEKPIHVVTFTYDFWIGRYEVTFDEYDAFSKASGKTLIPDYSAWAEYDLGRGTRPVINVSWWDAIAYCNWLSESEGLRNAYDGKGNLLDTEGKITQDITRVEGYRLPTEAEWEYAARGGENATETRYAGSNDLNEVGWYWQNSGENWLPGTDKDWDGGKIKANKCGTQPVGQKKANGLGLYDMSGNAAEWCHDWFGTYTAHDQQNPIGPKNGSRRVNRGGGWSFDAPLCRLASRSFYEPVIVRHILGFRLARTSF